MRTPEGAEAPRETLPRRSFRSGARVCSNVEYFRLPTVRPYWKGYLKLALVSCPIALYTASSSSERVAFRQLNKKTGNRLRQRHCHGAPGLRRSRWPGSPTQMNKISYSGYRFPPEIIQRAIWLYLRFTLSLRDVEDLLAERGVAASYETVRRWVNHFGPMIAADLRKRRLKPHTTWHLDEVYLKIDGRMVYLWRAVDAEGEVL